ncbi:MAG: transcriptional regulator [Candidatus Nitrotoga sp.]
MKNLTEPSIRNFDVLPDEAFVRIETVRQLLSCSGATVWRRVRDGQLVAPHRIGSRTTRWNVGELRENLRNLTMGKQ